MKKKGKPGVYVIENKLNGKMYIGCSKDTYNRLCQHKQHLRINKHHNVHLQNAFNKQGENAFEFYTLEECDEEFIFSQENYWCNLFNSHNRKYGYNIDPTCPTGKQRLSNDTKNKMSMSAVKRPVIAYTIYGEFYKEFSDLYKCAEEFKTFASNVHRKMNVLIHKKTLIDSVSSKYVFTDRETDVAALQSYWNNIFDEIKKCNGKYVVKDCFDRYIGTASSKELSNILNVTVSSISSSLNRKTYLKTLKFEINESSNC